MQFRRPRSEERRKAAGRLSLVRLAASCSARPPRLPDRDPGLRRLSEIGREELRRRLATPTRPTPVPATRSPARSDPERRLPRRAGGRRTKPDELARPDIDRNGPLPEIIYNLDRLPEPVRRMHDLIVEAAKSGDIEKLRPLIGMGEDVTQLSFGGIDGDPIDYLKGLSGDPEGQEILAIIEEVLSAGYVHLDAGTPNELYVWPYFFAIPLDKLDPRAACRTVQDRHRRRLRGHEDVRHLHLLSRRHHAGRPLGVFRRRRLTSQPS